MVSEWGLACKNRQPDQFSFRGSQVHGTAGSANTQNSTLTPAGHAVDCTSPGSKCSLTLHNSTFPWLLCLLETLLPALKMTMSNAEEYKMASRLILTDRLLPV